MSDFSSSRLLRWVMFLLCSAIVAISGCGDGTVRGAGSIDVPKSSRKSYVPPKFLPPKYEERHEVPAVPR